MVRQDDIYVSTAEGLNVVRPPHATPRTTEGRVNVCVCVPVILWALDEGKCCLLQSWPLLRMFGSNCVVSHSPSVFILHHNRAI